MINQELWVIYLEPAIEFVPRPVLEPRPGLESVPKKMSLKIIFMHLWKSSMICMESLGAWAPARPREIDTSAAEPSTTEPGVGVGTGVVRIEEHTLLGGTLFASIAGILSTLFLGSLSLKEPIDFGDIDIGAE